MLSAAAIRPSDDVQNPLKWKQKLRREPRDIFWDGNIRNERRVSRVSDAANGRATRINCACLVVLVAISIAGFGPNRVTQAQSEPATGIIAPRQVPPRRLVHPVPASHCYRLFRASLTINGLWPRPELHEERAERPALERTTGPSDPLTAGLQRPFGKSSVPAGLSQPTGEPHSYLSAPDREGEAWFLPASARA